MINLTFICHCSSNYNVEEVKYQTQSNMYNLETERLIWKTKIQNLPEILKTVTLSNAEIRALIIYKVFYPLWARFVDYGIKAYAAKCLIFELAKYFSYINLSQSNLCKREVKGRLTQSQMKEAKQRAADLLSKYSGILDQYPTHIIQAVKTISSNEGYCTLQI